MGLFGRVIDVGLGGGGIGVSSEVFLGYLGSFYWGYLEFGIRVKFLDFFFKLKGYIKILLVWVVKVLFTGKVVNIC